MSAAWCSARVGYLSLLARSVLENAFLEGLRDLGWIEGRNLSIEHRFCEGDAELGIKMSPSRGGG
jgi:hypothetical protein